MKTRDLFSNTVTVASTLAVYRGAGSHGIPHATQPLGPRNYYSDPSPRVTDTQTTHPTTRQDTCIRWLTGKESADMNKRLEDYSRVETV
eukprot:m.19000 g.19000  ORF g.19000 m.19000 type:complete len:89 (-) comp11673_c0_seq1:3-269(-)